MVSTTQNTARQTREWTSTARQRAFLSRDEYEVLYGGAKFGLKTDALLAWSIMRRQKYAHSRGLFIRRELAELTKQGAAWDRASEILGNTVKYNQTDHTITFPNGSVLEFGHCQHEADKLHYQGAQYDDECFDQLEQFTEDLYLYIQGACRVPQDNPPRDSDGNTIKARIRASANPGDVGHAFVNHRFITIAPPEQPYRYTVHVLTPDGEQMRIERDRVFIPSSVFDSIKAGVVGAEYLATLDAMPEPYRTAYMYGRWDIFIGQAFPEFSTVKHVVPETRPPETWRRVAGHDWGYDSPGHHLWGAVDPQGGIVIYREWSFRHLDPQEIAQSVLFKQGSDNVTVTWADPSVVAERRHTDLTVSQLATLEEKGQLQLSKYDQYRQAGLQVDLANNARIAGKQRIHTLLKARGDDVPYLRIMSCCPILIATLEGIQMDPARPEDVLTSYPSDARLRDDSYDALRYMLMDVPLEAIAPNTGRSAPRTYGYSVTSDDRQESERYAGRRGY